MILPQVLVASAILFGSLLGAELFERPFVDCEPNRFPSFLNRLVARGHSDRGKVPAMSEFGFSGFVHEVGPLQSQIRI
jgi:hypothetical protein